MHYLDQKDTTETCSLIDESKHVRKLCDEFNKMFKEEFGNMYEDIDGSEMTIEKYWKILDAVIEDKINWGRVIAIIAFAGYLAAQCLKSNRDRYVDVIREWTCSFFSLRVDKWIAENNGWVRNEV